MAWFRAGGAGIPSSLKSGMNDVLNKKFGTSTTYPPSDWPSDVNLLGPLPVKTASGAIASFSDGADTVPLKSLVFGIEPIQAAGTPSPSNPLPISGHTSLTGVHCGKNLIYPKYDGRDNAGITYTVNSDHSITCSGIATATSWAAANLSSMPDKMQLFPKGTYTISGGLSSDVQVYVGGKTVDGDTLTGIAYDTGNGATYTFTKDVYLYPQIRVASGTNLTTPVTVYIQLEVGSSASSFAPYSAETKKWEFPNPNPNIFDRTGGTYVSGKWKSDGTIDTSDWGERAYTIAVSGSTKYIASGEGFCYLPTICFFDSNNTFISSETCTVTDISYTFTTPSNCAYLGISFSTVLGTGENSVKEDFVIYSGQVNALTGEVESKSKKYVFDGTENFTEVEYEYQGTTYHYFRFYGQAFASKITNWKTGGDVICDSYPVYKDNYWWHGSLNGDKTAWIVNTVDGFCIRDDSYIGNVQGLISSLKGMEIVYELATPIETDMDSVDWQSKYGDNNIYCDTGDTECEYRADIALALGQ